jgi:hypothetical protein
VNHHKEAQPPYAVAEPNSNLHFIFPYLFVNFYISILFIYYCLFIIIIIIIIIIYYSLFDFAVTPVHSHLGSLLHHLTGSLAASICPQTTPARASICLQSSLICSLSSSS